MANVFYNNADLVNMANSAGLNSELTGGRIMRDFTFFHYKDFYGTTGDEGKGRGVGLPPSIDFFKNPNSQKKSVIQYVIANGNEYHNIITSGKADEPMLITGVALRLDVGKYFWQETESGVKLDRESSEEEQFETYKNILHSGRFILKVNNQEVAEYASLGILGSRLQTETQAIKDFGTKIQPLAIAPYIFLEENITVGATIEFEDTFQCVCPVRIGVELICFKFFKK